MRQICRLQYQYAYLLCRKSWIDYVWTALLLWYITWAKNMKCSIDRPMHGCGWCAFMQTRAYYYNLLSYTFWFQIDTAKMIVSVCCVSFTFTSFTRFALWYCCLRSFYSSIKSTTQHQHQHQHFTHTMVGCFVEHHHHHPARWTMMIKSNYNCVTLHFCAYECVRAGSAMQYVICHYCHPPCHLIYCFVTRALIALQFDIHQFICVSIL